MPSESTQASSKIADKIREAEMAASLHPPPLPEDDDGPLWFAIGAGFSIAVVAIAATVS